MILIFNFQADDEGMRSESDYFQIKYCENQMQIQQSVHDKAKSMVCTWTGFTGQRSCSPALFHITFERQDVQERGRMQSNSLCRDLRVTALNRPPL